jgi:hypothetical protein
VLRFLANSTNEKKIGVDRKVTMPTKQRSAKKKISDKELLSDAKKALRKTRRILEAELKEVDRYIKALDGHSSFCM